MTALSLVTLAVLSGCSGKDAGSPAGASGSIPLIAPTAGTDKDTCGIEGFVGDEAYVPIGGAEVGLQGTDKVTVTAQGGQFSFSFVAPGTYNVLVNAINFESAQRHVSCEAGAKITDLVFSLKELPKLGEAFKRVYQQNGRIGCAAGLVASTTTPDMCSKDNGYVPVGLDPEAKNKITLNPELGKITTAVFELTWLRSSGTGSEYLELNPYPQPKPGTTRAFCADGSKPLQDVVSPNQMSGKAPRSCVRLSSSNITEPVYDISQATNHLFVVRPHAATVAQVLGSQDESSKLVVAQPFTLWAAYFYNGLAAPEDYSPSRDG